MGPHGRPFGTVCARCSRLVRRLERETPVTNPVTDLEERQAWDQYFAAAFGNYVPGWVHQNPEAAAEASSRAADEALEYRRKRFGKAE